MKKAIRIGSVFIGGNNSIAIQSMTNTKTRDVKNTIDQIQSLTTIGCQIVRVAVENAEDAQAISLIKQYSKIPIIADIHFDYQLALSAINHGADKIRINPGNISDPLKLKQIVKECQKKDIPIRIGVNSGSLDKDIVKKYGGVTKDGLVENMLQYINLFESWDFKNLILSIKASNIKTFIEANTILDQITNYPIHIGLTESGTIQNGTIRSSYAIGTLLSKGIGNTIRISLHGDPLNEIPVAKDILAMFDLYNKPTLICCPTCGRTNYNITPVVKEIESFLNTINYKITIAIMGCVVNGPGEARDADIGIAGGNKHAVLFKKGKVIRKIAESDIVEVLKKEILDYIK